jgi:hypothetical protein
MTFAKSFSNILDKVTGEVNAQFIQYSVQHVSSGMDTMYTSGLFRRR